MAIQDTNQQPAIHPTTRIILNHNKEKINTIGLGVEFSAIEVQLLIMQLPHL
jgi:hypothetical protein